MSEKEYDTVDEKSHELIKSLYDAVINMDEDGAMTLSRSILANGFDPGQAVKLGLMAAMEKVAELYASDTYYVSELLLCSDALHAGLGILAPHIRNESGEAKRNLIIGTVEGDVHDVGKNLVKVMFEATGWSVHDLGKDVAPERFVEEQGRLGADVIGLSALMSTTMLAIPKAVRVIKSAYPQIPIMVGGAPLTREIAITYGADGYAHNAGEAIAEAKALLGLSQ
jgi:methanogenic corrinoid protein MtbC1